MMGWLIKEAERKGREKGNAERGCGGVATQGLSLKSSKQKGVEMWDGEERKCVWSGEGGEMGECV
jgi:hypothetical protein